MPEKDIFYCQLAKSIQNWLWIETEVYILYSDMMNGANSHLVSVTFHHIESFEEKLQLLHSCLTLFFSRESDEWKKWKSLSKRARNLNSKRNKIVHEPVILSVRDGKESIAISPSHFDARALVKGKTSYNGPAINSDYLPSSARVLEDHKIDLHKLYKLEKEFKSFAYELRDYREEIHSFLQAKLTEEKEAV